MMRTSESGHWWSDSDICIPSRQARSKCQNQRTTSKYILSSGALDLTFARELAAWWVANVKSAPLGLHATLSACMPPPQGVARAHKVNRMTHRQTPRGT